MYEKQYYNHHFNPRRTTMKANIMHATNELQYQALIQQMATKRKKTQKINLFHHLKDEVWKSLTLYNFQSGILENYYKEVSRYHTKINLQNCMKMILIFWMFSIAMNLHYSLGSLFSIFISLLSLVLIMGCYMSILLVNTYPKIIILTMTVLLLSYASGTLTQDSLYALVETNLTPALQTNLLMFAILPMKLSVALNIALINFGFIVTISILMIKRKKTFSNIHNLMFSQSISTIFQEVPLFSSNISLAQYFFGLFILISSVLFISIYLHFMNNIRRRSAFWTLGENVKAKRSIKMTMKQQLKWIEAVMPSVVKEEYWNHSEEIKSDKWTYIKTFDNVSILFADIVGFTKMSSQKSALEVVLLLNDIFHRFDEICRLTNCEKLGTLGDCYYCVAGCPLPRPDHAVCCIEMGLGMCKIIEQFNKDHNQLVNMRVGVHTGRVNAAIIGKKRFKFDVYSNDVIIANSMESSGEPGRVHISESSYSFIKNNYKVEEGKGLKIKKEEHHGIAGCLLKSFTIKTYFVDPEYSLFDIPDNMYSKKAEFKVFKTKHSKRQSMMPLTVDPESFDTIDELLDNEHEELEKIKESINFINGLCFDPDKQIELFGMLPIDNYTMMYYDRELEWHFRNFALEQVSDITVESMVSAKFIDCIVMTICSFIVTIESIILFPKSGVMSYFILFFHLVTMSILTMIAGWHSYVTNPVLNTNFKKNLFEVLSHWVMKAFFCFFFQNSMILTVVLLYYDCKRIYTDYTYSIYFFFLIFTSTFMVSLYFAADYLVKLFFATVTFIFLIFLFSYGPCVDKYKTYPSFYVFPRNTCLGIQNDTETLFIDRIKIGFISQIFMVYLLTILLIREVERNVRLWFFISREAEIGREETQIAMKNAEQVLYNIIPKYVFKNLMEQYEGNMQNFSFSYAVSIPQCAVIFASLSNFFSHYYREDYKGGENALRVLDKIFKMFDDLMEKSRYKDIEKIKTINDCYMVASGLNTAETDKNPLASAHLIALLYYGFDLIRSVDNFNDNYIIGTDKFEIKIGYNFGPVTAGIIGSTKPMYDIWGDTVNVASRMYSTGTPGKIQVPDYVEHHLRGFFAFIYRGMTYVKGKGQMHTYLVECPIVPDIYPKNISTTNVTRSVGRQRRQSTVIRSSIYTGRQSIRFN